MATTSHVDFVTKLGGSAITEKAKLETLKTEELSTAAHILGNCYRAGRRFVVVHGAGSFGHHQAFKYQVNKGYKETDPHKTQTQLGFCKTHLSVCKLNHHVVECLVEEGVPAIGLPPCLSWRTDGEKVVEDGMVHVRHLLEEGYIPCLHGDCVFDQSQNCKILSGDIIVKVLCDGLRPERLVFLTDVPGIYTKPPSQQDAQLIPYIKVKSDGSFICTMKTSNDQDNHDNVTSTMETSTEQHDVTGGIQLKLDTTMDIVNHHQGAISVMICNTAAYQDACMDGHFNTPQCGTIVKFME